MMSKNPGITLWTSSTETRVSISHLLRRSSANTPPAIPRALTRGSLIPIASFIFQHRRGAGDAYGGKFRVRTHIRRVLPAALALHAGRPLHLYGDVAARRGLIERHLRNDEQSWQLTPILFER